MQKLAAAILVTVSVCVGYVLGALELFENDHVHLTIASIETDESKWTMELCGESVILNEPIYVGAFSCEGSLALTKNGKLIDEIYITGGFDYHIVVNLLNDQKPIFVKVR